MNHLPLFQPLAPDNPFDDAGPLLVERINTQGIRAYKDDWDAVREQLLYAHNATIDTLTHDKALSILRTIATECPEAFSMKRKWKDKKRKRNVPILPEVDFMGIPDTPQVVREDYDILVHTPFPGDVERLRRHLARQIMNGELTHAQLVEMGNAGGQRGVRLGCAHDDGSAQVWARAIDSAMRNPRRVFELSVRKAFKETP